MVDKKVVYLLLISVAINLVFIGGVSFRALSFRETIPRPIPTNIGWAMRDLSFERRNELITALDLSANNQNADITSARRDMLKAQRDVNEVMQSANLEEKTLRNALSTMRTLSAQYQEISHEQMIRLFEEMTVQERLSASRFLNRGDARRNQGGPPRPFPSGGGGPRTSGPSRPN